MFKTIIMKFCGRVLVMLFSINFLVSSLPTVSNPISDKVLMTGSPWEFSLPMDTFTSGDGSPVHLYINYSLPGWLNWNYILIEEDSLGMAVAMDVSFDPSNVDTLACATYTSGFRLVNISDKEDISLIKTTDTQKNEYLMLLDDYLYASDEDQVLIYDVTDKANPALVMFYDENLDKPTNILVENDVMFLGDSSNGFKIFNVSNRSSIELIHTMPLSGNPLDFLKDGDVGYLLDDNEGVMVLDMSNLTDVTEIAFINPASGTYKGMDARFDLDLLFFSERGSTVMYIYDISIPSSPNELDTVFVTNTPESIVSVGKNAYLGTNDGIYVIDISEPDKAVLSYDFPTYHAYGMSYDYREGDYIFVADGTNTRILNVNGNLSFSGLPPDYECGQTYSIPIYAKDESDPFGTWPVVEEFKIDILHPTLGEVCLECFGYLINETESICSGHGTCVAPDSCSCEANYYGRNCNITTCSGGIFSNDSSSSYCSQRGSCWPFDVCSCQENYYGEDCEITICEGLFSNDSDSAVCSGRGDCDDYETCTCDENYYGSTCNITRCGSFFSNESTTCNSHGLCWPYETCNCDPDTIYKPPYCEKSNNLECSNLFGWYDDDNSLYVTISGSLTNNVDNQVDQFIMTFDCETYNLLSSATTTTTIFGSEEDDDMTTRMISCANSDEFVILGMTPNNDSLDNNYYSYTRIRSTDGSIVFSFKVSETERNILDVLEDPETGHLYLLGTLENGFHITELVSFGIYVSDKGYEPSIGDTDLFIDDLVGMRIHDDSEFVIVLGKTAGSMSMISKLDISTLTTEWVYIVGRDEAMETPMNMLIVEGEEEGDDDHVLITGKDEDSCLFIYKLPLSSESLEDGDIKNMMICPEQGSNDEEIVMLDMTTRLDDNGFFFVGYYEYEGGRTVGMSLSIDNDLSFIEVSQLFNGTKRLTQVERLSDRMIVLGEQITEEDYECKIIEFLGTKDACEVVVTSTDISDVDIEALFNVTSMFELNVTDRTSRFSNFSKNSFPSEISWFSDYNYCDGESVSSIQDLNVTNMTCGVITTCYGYPSVHPSACSGYGECVEFDVCECEVNYTVAEDCSYFTCFGVPNNVTSSSEICSGRGDCVGIDDCGCHDGYFGDVCQSWTCYGILQSNVDVVCSNGNGTCSSPDNCTCDEGYTGDECENMNCYGISHDNPSVCGGFEHGKCVGPNTCDCIDLNYTKYLPDCTIWECFGVLNNDTENVCSGYGNCTFFDTCECSANYTLDNCSMWYCNGTEKSDVTNPSLCSGAGNCTAPDVCECTESFYGPYCQYYSTICFDVQKNESHVCSGHGRCIGLDMCVCEEGYFYEDCSHYDCYEEFFNDTDTVCYGHGDCSSAENCTCDFGFGDVSESCETFSCYGILENNVSSVCSGHGNCTDYQTCECSFGYDLPECATWKCSGIMNVLDEIVCSGHGDCVELDTCVCDSSSYEGDNCEKWKCFNISSNLDEVCSGRGSCLDLDYCNCLGGYNGSECGYWECGGYNYTDNRGCHERGVCVSPDLCECDEGFEGSLCETFSCGGIDYQHPQTCNGRGTCLSPDQCNCNKTMGEEEAFLYSIYGDVCGIKFGKLAVRAGKNVLVVYMEVSENDFQKLVERALFDEPFPCHELFNTSHSTSMTRLFQTCELSNKNQFLEVTGSSIFLKVYLGHLEKNEFVDLMVTMNGEMVVSIGDEFHTIYYFEEVNDIIPMFGSDNDDEGGQIEYTMRSFASEADEIGKDLQTCKEKLHIQDQCFYVYECLQSIQTEEQQSSSSDDYEYTYFSVGYMPIPGSSTYGFSKFYFPNEVDCEEGRFENFLLFSPQRCYGSLLNDNFLVYERCSSDIFSVLSEYTVVQMFVIALFPMGVVGMVLLFFFCCCCTNLSLYSSRNILRKFGICYSSGKYDEDLLQAQKMKDIELLETDNVNIMDRVLEREIDKGKTVLNNFMNTDIDEDEDELQFNEPEREQQQQQEEEIEINEEDKKVAKMEWQKRAAAHWGSLRRVATLDGSLRSIRGMDNRLRDNSIRSINSVDFLFAQNTPPSSPTKLGSDMELIDLEEGGETVIYDSLPSSKSNRSTENLLGSGEISTFFFDDDDDGEGEGEGESTYNDDISTIGGGTDDDDDDSEEEEDIDPYVSNNSLMKRVGSEENRIEEDGDKAEMEEYKESLDSQKRKRGTVKRVFCFVYHYIYCFFCCPVYFHREFLKVVVMLCSVLLFEGLNLWFSTSEFLDTKEVDDSNKDFVLVHLVMSLFQYVLSISIFIYLILLLLVILYGTGMQFLQSPFLFSIAYGNLRENTFFRVFKCACLSFFFCTNLYCYLVKFIFQGSDERKSSLTTPNFWLSFFLPQGLLVYSMIQVLSYNGSSSRGMVKRIKKLGRCGCLCVKFPKINIPVWMILMDTDTMLDEFLKMIILVDRYIVKEWSSEQKAERLADALDLSLFRRSEEFGHLDWEVLKYLTFGDIVFLRLLFYPRNLRRRDYMGYFCNERMTSYRWWCSYCLFPMVCVCCFRSNIL